MLQKLPLSRSILLVVLSFLSLWIFLASPATVLAVHSANQPHSANKLTAMPPFSLLVTLQFREQQYLDQFLEFFRPMAQFVKDHEPDTLAYEVLLSDKDPLQALILERYKDKENAYLKVHRSSATFLEFRPKLKALMDAGHVTMSGHSYMDSRAGFADRV